MQPHQMDVSRMTGGTLRLPLKSLSSLHENMKQHKLRFGHSITSPPDPCHAPIDAPPPPIRPPDDNSNSLYARRARGEFASTHGGRSLSGCPRPPRPGGQQLRHSARPPRSPFPLSLPFLWRNKPALRQKVQGKQHCVLGAIRRHCCQTRLGAARELTAANAIHKSNSFRTAAVCGKSIFIHAVFVCPLGFFFLSPLSSHDRSLLLAQLRKNPNS